MSLTSRKTSFASTLVAGLALMLFSLSSLALTVPSNGGTGSFTVSVGNVNFPYTVWQLEQRFGSSGSWSLIAQLPSNGSHSVSVNQAGQYFYRARMHNPNYTAWGASGPISGNWITSGPVSVSNPPPPVPGMPGAIAASNIGSGNTSYSGSYTLSWGASSTSGVSYRWRENNGSWNNTGTSRTTPTLTRNNGSYTYNVQACNSSGCSGSRSRTIIVDRDVAPTVGRSTATSTTGNYSISWTAGRIQGKTGEAVWIYENGVRTLVYGRNSSGAIVANTQPLSQSKSTSGTWTYHVRSCINVGHMSYGSAPAPNTGTCVNSSATTVSVAFPTPAKVGAVSVVSGGTYATNGQVTISWPSVTHATKYDIRYGQQGTSISSRAVVSTTNTSHQISNLTEGVWEFQVRACNGTQCNQTYSDVVSETIVILPPLTLSSSVQISTTGAFVLSWTAISIPQVESEYRLYRDGIEIHRTLALSHSLTSQIHGSHNFHVARCVVGSTSCSYASNTLNVQVILPPQALSTPTMSGLEGPDLDTNGSFGLTWAQDYRASYYVVSYARRGDAQPSEQQVDALSVTMNLEQGLWELKVKACNAIHVCGGFSPKVRVMVSLVHIDEEYQYDNLGRLREVIYGDGSKETYNLDKQDNRNSVIRSPQNGS